MTSNQISSGVTFQGAGGSFAETEAAHPSEVPLLRPQALAAANECGFGDTIVALPISWGVLTAFCGSLGVALVAFLFIGTYSRTETAIGVVRSTAGDMRITVPAPGIVQDVAVREGQSVTAGQRLLTIDTTRNGVDGQPIDRESLATLDLQLENLTARLRATDSASAITSAATPTRLDELRRQRLAAANDENSGMGRLKLAEDALAKVMPAVADGFVSDETVRRRQDEILALRQSVSASRATEARIDAEITELTTTASQQPMALAQQRGLILDQIEQARRDRAAIRGQHGFVLSAPSGGLITAVQVNTGDAVDAQRSLMTISRPKGGIVAELFVPSRMAGFLEPGQPVKLHYDAFAFQRFGSAVGVIRAISSTVLKPQEVQAPIKIDEPVYRVVVDLKFDKIAAYGRVYQIRPGQALTANITLERRRFADWLLDPVVALRGHI